MLARYRYPLLLALLAAGSFLPFLGGLHLFDWDEVNFAECAREMIMTGDYLRVHVDYLPFWEKPPLFIWLQAGAMHLFGIGEYAARFPNAVCGIITLLLLYRLGQKLYNAQFGFLWALAYFGAILPNLYFRSGIIDPWFNLFIFLAVYHVVLFHWKKDGYSGLALAWGQWAYLALAGFWLGLAMLTKGPAALAIVGLTMAGYWGLSRLRFYINPLEALFFLAVALVVTGIWFSIETARNGPWFVSTFLVYQYRLFSTPDAGHGGFFGYHFVVLLLGCFPISVFGLRALFPQLQQHLYQRNFKTWMLLLFWVVLILFSIVKSKIVHYSSMCYFPLSYLAALSLHQMLEGKIQFAGWMRGLLLGLGGLLATVLLAVPFAGQNPAWVQGLIQDDPFARANLDAQVTWHGWEALTGVYFLVIIGLAVYWLGRPAHQLRGTYTLLGGTAGLMLLVVYVFFPKVEPYTQGAAIDFFKSLEGKDCYAYTSGYRSYANYFYPKTLPDTRPKFPHGQEWEDYLFRGPVDKEVFVAAKLFDEARLDSVATLRKLYAKNGFVFYHRPKTGHR